MRRYNTGGNIKGSGSGNKRIVGTSGDGKNYLVNYGSGSIPKAQGDKLVREGKLSR
jgi:hypothetical protein